VEGYLGGLKWCSGGVFETVRAHNERGFDSGLFKPPVTVPATVSSEAGGVVFTSFDLDHGSVHEQSHEALAPEIGMYADTADAGEFEVSAADHPVDGENADDSSDSAVATEREVAAHVPVGGRVKSRDEFREVGIVEHQAEVRDCFVEVGGCELDDGVGQGITLLARDADAGLLISRDMLLSSID